MSPTFSVVDLKRLIPNDVEKAWALGSRAEFREFENVLNAL